MSNKYGIEILDDGHHDPYFEGEDEPDFDYTHESDPWYHDYGYVGLVIIVIIFGLIWVFKP